MRCSLRLLNREFTSPPVLTKGPRLYKSEASALTESIRTHSPALIWWACWVECELRGNSGNQNVYKPSPPSVAFPRATQKANTLGVLDVFLHASTWSSFFWVILVAGGLIITYPLSFMTLDQHSPLLDYTTHLSLSGLVGTVQSRLCWSCPLSHHRAH